MNNQNNNYFSQDSDVKEILAELKHKSKWGSKDGIISDITDDESNQYVDLVMEGGGVLGVALVGYTYVLEELGIRFVGLGGTSAGSINALLLASIGGYSEKKSDTVLNEIKKKSFFDFVDANKFEKCLISKFISSKLFKSFFIAIPLIVIAILLIFCLIFPLFQYYPFPLINNIVTITVLIVLLLISIFFLIPIIKNKGICPGNNFLFWIKELLQGDKIKNTTGYGVKNVSDLYDKFRANEKKLFIRNDNAEKEEYKFCPCKKIAIFAAEVNTETKVRFPYMAELYWEKDNIIGESDKTNMVSPAEFVRASMSIPLFFYPYKRKSIPNANTDNNLKEKWISWTGYGRDNSGLPENRSDKSIPPAIEARKSIKGHENEKEKASSVKFPVKNILFIDGGINSNFPIDCFHKTDKFIKDNEKCFYGEKTKCSPTKSSGDIPLMPTFGIKLGNERKEPKSTKSLLNLIGQIFNSARHIRDTDFLTNNPDYYNLIAYAKTNETFVSWLKFDLSEEEQNRLFVCGAKAAGEFLKNFDWQYYKLIREGIKIKIAAYLEMKGFEFLLNGDIDKTKLKFKEASIASYNFRKTSEVFNLLKDEKDLKEIVLLYKNVNFDEDLNLKKDDISHTNKNFGDGDTEMKSKVLELKYINDLTKQLFKKLKDKISN